AAGFPAPNREAWLAMVEKTLKGASIETLTRKTLEDLPIQPLYEAADAAFPAKAAPGWDARTLVAHGDAAAANEQALTDLAGGARSLLLRIDPVGLDAGFLGPTAADWLGALARHAPAAELALHLDPLSAFAEGGASPGPL